MRHEKKNTLQVHQGAAGFDHSDAARTQPFETSFGPRKNRQAPDGRKERICRRCGAQHEHSHGLHLEGQIPEGWNRRVEGPAAERTTPQDFGRDRDKGPLHDHEQSSRGRDSLVHSTDERICGRDALPSADDMEIGENPAAPCVDVQFQQGCKVCGKSHRHRRPLHGQTRKRDSAFSRRKDSNTGVGSYPAASAAAAWPDRTAHARLRQAWHNEPLRSVQHREREGDRQDDSATSREGVSLVHEPRGSSHEGAQVPRRDPHHPGQQFHTQDGRGSSVAEEPSGISLPLYADQFIMAERRGGLVLTGGALRFDGESVQKLATSEDFAEGIYRHLQQAFGEAVQVDERCGLDPGVSRPSEQGTEGTKRSRCYRQGLNERDTSLQNPIFFDPIRSL